MGLDKKRCSEGIFPHYANRRQYVTIKNYLADLFFYPVNPIRVSQEKFFFDARLHAVLFDKPDEF